MFAIAFDLVVADTAQHHPKGVSQAYADIGSTLANYGFNWVQGSLYTNASADLANLFAAVMALKVAVWLVGDDDVQGCQQINQSYCSASARPLPTKWDSSYET